MQEKVNAAQRRRQVSGTGPVSFGVTTTTIGGFGGFNPNINIDTGKLSVAGDVMMGPIGFNPQDKTISGGILTISGLLNQPSSYIIVDGEGSANDDLNTIAGAQFAGQFLVLKAKAGVDITLKHLADNITIPGGADHVITADTSVVLVFDNTLNKWMLVASHAAAGGGGGGDDLGNHTATQDLQMSTYDIIGVNNIDLDGASATVEGVVNLQFYNTSHSINSVSGIMLYQANASDVHRFAIGGVTKMELQTTKLDMSVATLDMNQGNITDVDSITFKNDTTNDYILSNTTGLLYNVNATDEHYFKVGGTTKMEVDSNEIEMFDDVRMNNNDIYEVANLRFNTSGQVFTTSSSEILYQVPSGDAHGFYVAASKVCEINDTYLEMQTNRYIDYGANITLTANAGFASLPANPIGFIKCKVNGSDARVPYYAV